MCNIDHYDWMGQREPQSCDNVDHADSLVEVRAQQPSPDLEEIPDEDF